MVHYHIGRCTKLFSFIQSFSCYRCIMILQAQRLTPYSLHSSVRYSIGTAAAVIATTNTSPRRIGGGTEEIRRRRRRRPTTAAWLQRRAAVDIGWRRGGGRTGAVSRPCLYACFVNNGLSGGVVKKNNGASYAVEWRRTRKYYDNLSNRVNKFFSPVHFDDSRIKNNLIGVV